MKIHCLTHPHRRKTSPVARLTWMLAALWLIAWSPTLLQGQTPIACGRSVSGVTTIISQVDIYTLNGTAGQKVSFAMYGPITCANSGHAMDADIYGPDAHLLATIASPCDSGAALSLTLTNSGTYTILVHE